MAPGLLSAGQEYSGTSYVGLGYFPICHCRETCAPRFWLVLRLVYGRYILITVAEREDPLDACSGFEWDEANTHKNWERHRVSPEDAEDVFFNEPLVVRSDIRHSRREKRYYALGQTDSGRCLFVAFTIRRSLVRIISVRDMNRRERDAYAKHEDEARA